jgi:hypothetical protein
VQRTGLRSIQVSSLNLTAVMHGVVDLRDDERPIHKT